MSAPKTLKLSPKLTILTTCLNKSYPIYVPPETTDTPKFKILETTLTLFLPSLPPLRSRPLEFQLGDLGSAVRSPGRVFKILDLMNTGAELRQYFSANTQLKKIKNSMGVELLYPPLGTPLL